MYKEPELFILNTSNDEYTSELRIYFYQKNTLFDVIEFFIFFEGHPEATVSEFEIGFIEELDSIFLKAENN